MRSRRFLLLIPLWLTMGASGPIGSVHGGCSGAQVGGSGKSASKRFEPEPVPTQEQRVCSFRCRDSAGFAAMRCREACHEGLRGSSVIECKDGVRGLSQDPPEVFCQNHGGVKLRWHPRLEIIQKYVPEWLDPLTYIN